MEPELPALGSQLALILSVTLLCMLSPGPDMVLVMRNTLTGDRRGGLATSLGILTGNCVHISYCMLGVGVLVAHSVVAYSVLKWLGAAYLIFLGVSGLRSASSDGGELGGGGLPLERAHGAFTQGLLNNLLNPKGALFYLGVFTQVITPGTPWLRGLLLVVSMVATSALFWLVFVLTLHLPKVRSMLVRSRRTVERAFGLLLIALGLRVATQD